MVVTFQDTLPPAESFSTLRACLDAAEMLFIESMQDAADNQWHLIRDRLEGATERELLAEMERWWDHHVRRFRTRLRRQHEQDQSKRFKRDNRLHLIHVQEQLQAAQIEIESLRCDLAGAEALADYLKEQRRCRNCDGELGP